jgi:hypothetical protein
VEALRDVGPSIIFNWGFPPACLATVKAFRAASGELWWFDGDRAAARSVHEHSGKNLTKFDQQVERITARWLDIESTFGTDRVLRVLDANATFLAPDIIYRRVFGD